MPTENIHLLLAVYQKVAPHAFPYLVMMALRIVELHRVLKLTGSLYLHCDATMSSYLKTICDVIFRPENFQNEIIWKRTSAHSDAKRFARVSDTIFFYSKNDSFVWNKMRTDNNEDYIRSHYTNTDANGRRFRYDNLVKPKGSEGYFYKLLKCPPPPNGWRMPESKAKIWIDQGRIEIPPKGKVPAYKRYLDETEGTVVKNIWDDIPPINSQAKEALGYPTQKPKALLERIIKASSNEGDIVLDAFCGCGTTIDAAEGLHRKWIGIDISPIAISLIKRRLKHAYKKDLAEFEVRGTPTDEQSAQRLWKENTFAFQDWWITEFEAFSATFGTKGADKGVDGIALYAVDNKEATARVAFQVKGGEKVQSKDIDALLGAMEKHKCQMGVFLTTAEPTKPMLDTAAGAGYVKFPGYDFPKFQIVTLKDYFAGKRPKLPNVNITFKAAQHTSKKKENQESLEL
jgi:site-specific DNA-methyltransferase (adenine-specific)